jgi:hypothetical protein
MRKIRVKLSSILRAIERAKTISDDWQAECCEILLIPAVAKRWQELNANFAGLHVKRIDGAPYAFTCREDNQARCEAKRWREVAGYVLVLFTGDSGDYCWNGVRDDYYGHSASTAWDGIRRDTISSFAHDLRTLAYGHRHPDYDRALARAGVEFVDDVAALSAVA